MEEIRSTLLGVFIKLALPPPKGQGQHSGTVTGGNNGSVNGAPAAQGPAQQAPQSDSVDMTQNEWAHKLKVWNYAHPLSRIFGRYAPTNAPTGLKGTIALETRKKAERQLEGKLNDLQAEAQMARVIVFPGTHDEEEDSTAWMEGQPDPGPFLTAH
ncbi:hypothetical protein P154DRAFT_525106 [Amniculicola lignicola CBS 123094]|uniref:Uncharacterized protein n=1 Tax=Amniculicola lignicola CBS 123094 TaxID=1392246 RepID=A0A6A5W8N0_9PLEO|nr:hypothetical protein P154DRAFT_525106 [Amniculicola lignicola CBS 123094]